MAMEQDWYAILGLEKGMEISLKAIRKAFRQKALLCHPDKRPDDPLASAKFQSIQKAYDVLSDKHAREAYDDLLKREEAKKKSREKKPDSKKRKMMEDLNRKENLYKAHCRQQDNREEAVKHVLQAEIAKMRENEKILKVSWQDSQTFSAVRLKAIFEQFGVVEDIRLDSAQCLACVVMSSRDEAVHATRSITNLLLLVTPLVVRARFSSSRTLMPQPRAFESNATKLWSLDSSAFHSHEEAVLKKLRCKSS